MNRPAYLEEISALWRRGDLDAMGIACREKIEQLANTPNTPPSEIAALHEFLGRAYGDLGDNFAEILELERALELHRTESDIPRNEIVRCLGHLGLAYLWTGRPAEAEDKLDEALVLLDHMPEREQVGRPFVLQYLAVVHLRNQELDVAEKLVREAIKLHGRYSDPHHAAFAFGLLGKVYERQGNTVAADRTMEKAIRWLRHMKEERDEASFANMLTVRGLQLEARGRIEEARDAHAEAVSILQKIRKPGHPVLERVQLRLAKVSNS